MSLALTVNPDPWNDLCIARESERSKTIYPHISHPSHSQLTEVYFHNDILTLFRITSHCNKILGHCVPKLALALTVNPDPWDDLCIARECERSKKIYLCIPNPSHAPSTKVYLYNRILTSSRITSHCNKILGHCVPKLALVLTVNPDPWDYLCIARESERSKKNICIFQTLATPTKRKCTFIITLDIISHHFPL